MFLYLANYFCMHIQFTAVLGYQGEEREREKERKREREKEKEKEKEKGRKREREKERAIFKGTFVTF